MNLGLLVGSFDAEFVAETIDEAGDEGGSAYEDDVAVERGARIDVDGVDGGDDHVG